MKYISFLSYKKLRGPADDDGDYYKNNVISEDVTPFFFSEVSESDAFFPDVFQKYF